MDNTIESTSLLTPLSSLILEMIDNEIEQVVNFHTQSENIDDAIKASIEINEFIEKFKIGEIGKKIQFNSNNKNYKR